MQRTSETGTPADTAPALKAATFHCMGTVVSSDDAGGGSVGGPGMSGTRDGSARQPPSSNAFSRTGRTGSACTGTIRRRASWPAANCRSAMPRRTARPVRGRAGVAAADAGAPSHRSGPTACWTFPGSSRATPSRRAGRRPAGLGRTDWCLNAGGDVLVSGSPVPRHRRNPGTPASLTRPTAGLAAAFPLGGDGGLPPGDVRFGGARGPHLAAARGRPEFVQVSVAAADIVTADVLATAIVAGGRRCWTGPRTAGTSRCWPSLATAHCWGRRGSGRRAKPARVRATPAMPAVRCVPRPRRTRVRWPWECAAGIGSPPAPSRNAGSSRRPIRSCPYRDHAR